MSEIWHVGRLGETVSFERDSLLETVNGEDGDVTPKRYSALAGRSIAGWRKIGLMTEGDDERDSAQTAELELFRDVGELGLECLVSRCLFILYRLLTYIALFLDA